MRSVAEDLTTQAKIRDAAIGRFPVDGMNGTTVRAIAADAGVSPGLVIHHFGSKEGLRQACDQHVVDMMMQIKSESLSAGSFGEPSALAAAYQLAAGPVRYLAWTLASGTDTSARLFDDLVDEATELLVQAKKSIGGTIHGDPRKQAAVLVAIQTSGLIMHEHLSRAFGVDVLSPEGLIATAPYTLQVLSGDLFDQEIIAQSRQALSQLNESQEAST